MTFFFKWFTGIITAIFTKSTASARKDFEVVTKQQNLLIGRLVEESDECKKDRKLLHGKIDDLHTAILEIKK